MSSFIVSKKEYIKAAGLVYGIEESNRHPFKYFLDRLRSDFVDAYCLNVASVNEQYSNHEPLASDLNEYDGLFETYRHIGRRIAREELNGMTLESVRPKLQMFFQSVLYQIENEAANKIVSAFFFRVTQRLYDRDMSNADGWWGSVDLEEAA